MGLRIEVFASICAQKCISLCFIPCSSLCIGPL